MFFWRLIILLAAINALVIAPLYGDNCDYPDDNPLDPKMAGCSLVMTRTCVNKASDSSYFKPKIAITLKSCSCINLGPLGQVGPYGCSTDHAVFNTYGECKWLWWGGLVPIRFCARSAAPCSTCDPKQIDADNLCTCSNNCCDTAPSYGNTATNRVRVCAYQDPCDPSDTSGCWPGSTGYMPYHHYTPVTPQMATYSRSVAQSTTIALHATALAILPFAPAMSTVVAVSSAILNIVGNYMNLWVYNDNGAVGCVEIPPAPPPPPFCKVLTGTLAPIQPVTERICAYNEISTAANNCVQTLPENNSSKLASTNPWGIGYSSFERPLIRVGFNNPVKFCENNSCSGRDNNQSCVCYNLGSASVKDIHCKYHDILPICNHGPTPDNTPCVNLNGYKKSGHGVFRVIYADRDGQPTNWYQPPEITSNAKYCLTGGGDHEQVCDICNSSSCHNHLKLYGVNDANFYDMGYCYPQAGQSTGISVGLGQANMSCPGATTHSEIVDLAEAKHSFVVNISADNPLELCASEVLKGVGNSKLAGCTKRPPMPSPIVTACDTAIEHTPYITVNNRQVFAPNPVKLELVNCKSSNSKPAMVVGLGFNHAVLQTGIISYPAASSERPTCPKDAADLGICHNNSSKLILHGVTFTAAATDNNYTLPDNKGLLDSKNYYNPESTNSCFAGDPCNGYNTMSSCTASSCRFYPGDTCCYTGGLRYVEGYYWSGASKLCLHHGYTPAKTVLAKLKGGKVSTHPDDVLMNPYNNCDQICYQDRHTPPCPYGMTCCNSCCHHCSYGAVSQCTKEKSINLATLVDNQTFDASGATEGTRPQTPLEAGLCVDIPPVICNQHSAHSGDGYAVWPKKTYHPGATQTALGCQEGYKLSTGKALPTRTCFQKDDEGIWGTVSHPCK